MAEKIRKCPTSHAEKGDKNGDRENAHSCLVRKKLKKGHSKRNILRPIISSAACHGG
ncbi:hypothetical protein [Pseudomonas sp. GM78]|uniref:hypothetical protein n=1 Tax=Pseudomonas sp. GM78 TaxID=1144337 RepID=UPI0012F9CC33|nr:hypothetical protein [Pseudomonas sp. GM78]